MIFLSNNEKFISAGIKVFMTEAFLSFFLFSACMTCDLARPLPMVLLLLQLLQSNRWRFKAEAYRVKKI